MKLEKHYPPKQFVPRTITIESEVDLIGLRAILDAARRGQTIDDVMREHWGRKAECGPPQPHDVRALARSLHDFVLGDE